MNSVIGTVIGNLVQLNPDRLQGIQFARSTPSAIINDIVKTINSRTLGELEGYGKKSPYALRIIPNNSVAELPAVTNQEALAFRTGGRCFIWRSSDVDLMSSMEPGLVISFIIPEQFPFRPEGSNISITDIANEVTNVIKGQAANSLPEGDWRKFSDGILEVLKFYSNLLQVSDGCNSGVWWKCIDRYLKNVSEAFLSNMTDKFGITAVVFGAAALPLPDKDENSYRGNWDAKTNHYKLLTQYFNTSSSIEEFAKFLCLIKNRDSHPILNLDWDTTYDTSISFSEHLAAAVIEKDGDVEDIITAWSQITVSDCKRVLRQAHALLSIESLSSPAFSFEMFKKRYVVFPIHNSIKTSVGNTDLFAITDVCIRVPLEYSDGLTQNVDVRVEPAMVVAGTKAISFSYSDTAKINNDCLEITGTLTVSAKSTQYENWFQKPIGLKVLKRVNDDFVTKESIAYILIPHPSKTSIFLTVDDKKHRNKPLVEFFELNGHEIDTVPVDIDGTSLSTIVISNKQELAGITIEHGEPSMATPPDTIMMNESGFKEQSIYVGSSLIVGEIALLEFTKAIEPNVVQYWSPILASIRQGNIETSSPPNKEMVRDVRGKIEGIIGGLIENVDDHSRDEIGMLNMVVATGGEWKFSNSTRFENQIMWLSDNFAANNFHASEMTPSLSPELIDSQEYIRFSAALVKLLKALKSVSPVVPKWISRTPLKSISPNDIEEYIESYFLLLKSSQNLSHNDQHWIRYAGGVTLYDEANNDIAGILLSPLNPIRLGWMYCAESAGSTCEDNEQNLFQLIESWNYPWIISAPALTGSSALLAIPLDPGDKQIFLGWSALLKFDNNGGSPVIPSLISGFKFPGVSSSGLNEGGVRAAIGDFLRVHPYLSSLHIDLFRRDVGTRSTELDSAICKEIANSLNSNSRRSLQSVQVSDSVNRLGTVPTYDSILEYIDYENRDGISFGWKQYKNNATPYVDIRLVEDASTKIAVDSSENGYRGVLGNVPLKRFPTRLKSDTGGNHRTHIYFNVGDVEKSGSWQDNWISSLHQVELINNKNVGILFNADLQKLGLGSNAKWTITGNIHSDPELLSATLNEAGQNKLLWEWRPAFLENTDGSDGLRLDSRSYNTVAQIPSIFRERLKGSEYSDTQINFMIGELGRRGIGLSSLLAMGYNHVTGAFGFFYSFRILNAIQKNLPADVYGLVIPVDAANKFITSLVGDSSASTDKRADLLLMVLDCRQGVKIELVPIEVTHRHMENPQPFPPPLSSTVSEKLEQLDSTSKQIEDLVNIANSSNESSMIRLAIANLIETGFIISLGSSGKEFGPKAQALIMEHVAKGKAVYEHRHNFMLFFQPRVQENLEENDVGDYYLPLPGNTSNGLVFIDNKSIKDDLWNEGSSKGINFISEKIIGWVVNDTTHVSASKPAIQRDSSQNETTGKTNKMIDIILGEDSSGNSVRWQPSHPSRGLNNAHMVIVGSSGSGKTTTINSIVKSLKSADIPSIIFDFKDDYVGQEFGEMSGAKVHNTIHGIPINPLDIAIDPDTEMAKVTNTVYEISGAIRQVFQLGVQQEANLKEALFTLYERYGIKKGFQKLEENQVFPTFDELYDVIDEIGDGKLLNRISSLFDLDMFKPSAEGLESFLEGSVVIRFTQLPTDEVKKVGSELLLMGIYNFILRLGHSKEPRFCIIIDEAHKIANLKAIDTLMREARAYGVSIILSTQRASDLSAHVYSNAGSIIIMKLSESGDAAAAAKVIGDQGSSKNLGDSIRSLGIGEAYLRNDHYNSPNVKLKIIHPDKL